jgi:hypothetical protein
MGGCLYAAGGTLTPSSVERYDVASDTWTEITDMRTGRSYCSAVAIPSVGPTGVTKNIPVIVVCILAHSTDSPLQLLEPQSINTLDINAPLGLTAWWWGAATLPVRTHPPHALRHGRRRTRPHYRRVRIADSLVSCPFYHCVLRPSNVSLAQVLVCTTVFD